MKIKFNSDDELPLNKVIEICSTIIVVRAVFHENSKCYPQFFLDECLYKLWIIKRFYILIELTFLKELIFMKQVHQKSVTFVTIHYWHFLNKGFKFQPNVCNRCHDLLMMSMNLIDIAILNIEGSNCCCIITGIRNEAINLLQNIDSTEKSGTLYIYRDI